MVEKELDAFIERRSRREPTPDELEPSYAESVRRYNARRRKEIAAQWYAYHADQAERLRRTMEPLIAFHEAKARELLEEGSA
jgi:hypothetical protein